MFLSCCLQISLYSHLSIPSKSAYDKNDDDDDAGETKSICIPFIFCGWVCFLYVLCKAMCGCMFACLCVRVHLGRCPGFRTSTMTIFCVVKRVKERNLSKRINIFVLHSKCLASILFGFGFESERAIVLGYIVNVRSTHGTHSEGWVHPGVHFVTKWINHRDDSQRS